MLGCRGGGGGGASCPGRFILRPPSPPPPPPPTETFYDHFTCFKLSEYEVASITAIMHVKLSCIPCRLVSKLGCRGGGKLSRVVYLAPPPHLIIDSSTSYDHFTCFKLSEYEVESITVIMQVKWSCIPCHLVSYAWLQRRGASCSGLMNFMNMKLHQIQS